MRLRDRSLHPGILYIAFSTDPRNRGYVYEDEEEITLDGNNSSAIDAETSRVTPLIPRSVLENKNYPYGDI